jgi:hypothetical protein
VPGNYESMRRVARRASDAVAAAASRGAFRKRSSPRRQAA